MSGKPFEHAVARHGATVLRVCRALLPVHDADDAWSETFLSALRAWPALPDDADVEAWLVVIARRRAIDLLRSSARALPVAEVPDGPSALGVPGAADLDLAAAVRALPAKQRAAVVHHHLVGLPYAEVAAITGGTADAARRAAADGVATLRRVLGATGGGDR